MNFSGWVSTREELQRYRSDLFTKEQQKQKNDVGRIEKIEVRYLGVPEDTTLIMNKSLSTPYNCAQRKFDHSLPIQFTNIHRFPFQI